MKGFMRRRGDAWELRVYLGGDPGAWEAAVRESHRAPGKREAQRILNEVVTEAERGLAGRTNVTAGGLIEAWFEHATGDFSPKTVKETRGFSRGDLLPAIGGVPLSKLKPSDLDRPQSAITPPSGPDLAFEGERERVVVDVASCSSVSS